jgi:tetratricopeptide (TPR) repeat protein
MKKFLALMISFVVAGLIFAQQPADFLMRARALIESGKNSEAIVLLSDVFSKNADYRFLLERAEAEVASGDYSSAASDYQSANSLASYSGEFGMARISAIKGDAVSALKHLENNINSPFKKSEKEIMLDAAFSLIENTPEWRIFWKKDRYSVLETKMSEIVYYVSIGKSEDAVNLLKEISSDYREDQDVQYATALIQFSQGKYNETIAAMTKLLDKEKKNEKYLRLLAKAQSLSGNPSGASQSYSNLIDMGVVDASLFILRAECYNKTGEREKALKDISKFLELYPENRGALSFAGKVEAQSGDNLKALDYFSKNLKLHPNDPECFTDRASSYFASGTWNSAIEDYSMALDIQPSNSETWLNKGISLVNSSKLDDACHDFRAALKLGNKKAAGYISKYCIK